MNFSVRLGNCGSIEVPEPRGSLLNLLLASPELGAAVTLGPVAGAVPPCSSSWALPLRALGPARGEVLRPPPEAAAAVSCWGGVSAHGPIGCVHRTKLSNSRAGQGLKGAAAA